MHVVSNKDINQAFAMSVRHDETLKSVEELYYKRRKVRDIGIYFLFWHKSIVYVGQTTNGDKRVYEHLKDKQFDSYAFIPVSRKGYSNKLEKAYILKFKPLYNITHNGEFQKQLKKKQDRKAGYKTVPNRCLDCNTEFGLGIDACPNCYGVNIKYGGRFKVNKKEPKQQVEVTSE